MGYSLVEEYTAPGGDTISLWVFTDGSKYQVTNFKGDDCMWCLDFATEALARAEYERWRK